MKLKYIAALLAAVSLTACTDSGTKNESVNSRESVSEATSIAEESESSAENTAANTTENTEEKETTTVEEPSSRVNEKDRVPLTDEELSYVSEKAVNAFMEALEKGDVATVAMYCNSTEAAVNSWISSVKIDSFEIVGNYKEAFKNSSGENYEKYYTLVKADVSSGDGKVFTEENELYKFYGPDATGPIGEIISDSSNNEQDDNYQLSRLCENYEIQIGKDFSEGGANTVLEIPYAYTILRQFGYVNHNEINSMEELTSAVMDNIALENIEWDHSELAYNDDLYEEYEIPPKGSSWLYYGVSAITDNKITIDYYADMFGFSAAKTVEYSYKTNENGTPCITAVNTVNDYGFEISFGSV